MSLEWLIVGGGIHGVHVAARLIGEAKVSPERLRIIDPQERLLSRWRACTDITGMTHLRSAAVHHLDLKADDLFKFAGHRRNRKPGAFSGPYNRPSLSLFNRHCDRVIDSFGLSVLHIQAKVESCEVQHEAVVARASNGKHLEAENVVLAIGPGERPKWPSWARQEDDRIHHIFEPSFNGWPLEQTESVAVVGGGISAAQVALRLLSEGHHVHLVSRHPLRQHHFDSDPGWLGPKFLTAFRNDHDFDNRRTVITNARYKGSVPPEVRRAIIGTIKRKELRWYEDEVEEYFDDPNGLRLQLASKEMLSVDRVLLATGFVLGRPGGKMVDDLVVANSLPCAKCGFPIVDEALRWHPRIYVSGPLAELEIGPVARNIAGARHAGDRLVETLRAQRGVRQRKSA